jgi:pentatricopeptide repeat protein
MNHLAVCVFIQVAGVFPHKHSSTIIDVRVSMQNGEHSMKRMRKTTDRIDSRRSTGIHPPGYKPIEDYGIIGDLHSIALVGIDGSIDWCCLPDFDSPSIFAALLDVHKGGYFKIAPIRNAVRRQMYLPGTCILLTRFLSDGGVGEVVDFMPIHRGARTDAHVSEIVRIVRVVRGSFRFRLECYPAPDYARKQYRIETAERGVIFAGKGLEALGLTSPVPLKIRDTGVVAEWEARTGTDYAFLLRQQPPRQRVQLVEHQFDTDRTYDETMTFWRNWGAGIKYNGRWREMVQRSAMVLKLLTFAPTGAIVAAPTTSLPEDIGGMRNWDYRYTWIRDAAFTIYSLIRLGLTDEAGAFMKWIDERAHEEEYDGSLQIVYSVRGSHELNEHELRHLEGYRGSSPVRIGNKAHEQLQLDIYGELLDTVYLANKHQQPISYDLWIHITRALDFVCKNWRRKDEGIWEIRGGQHHFVSSKLMCWVALDRGLRIALDRGFPAPIVRWRNIRDTIFREIMTRGWNEERQSFVQHYDTEELDASNLLMPLVFFISAGDPRMQATIDATMQTLVSDSLVHRYQIGEVSFDGLEGKEGTFSICTFWLAECLARSGRLEEARLIFEKMHSYANHLGLYSEQIGSTGEALGNFPQAFTHLSLITAAFNLDQALDRSRRSINPHTGFLQYE